MLILNDVHLGFDRQAGATPASREALRSYLFKAFGSMFDNGVETHVLINGDLFDKFEVAGRDWIDTFLILNLWLSGDSRRRLTLVAGNHDHSAKGDRVSSFEMLCRVLAEQFVGEDRFTVIGIDGMAAIDGDVVWALAHCSNQDLFDQKINELLGLVKSGDQVLLHANYDNKFAVESDHSLNLSREQVMKFVDLGVKLYFAHEHQAKTDFKGSVTIFGNQWPTSVSDCMGNTGGTKFAHTLNDGNLTKIETWNGLDGPAAFCEIDWRELAGVPVDSSVGFFRVVGTATMNEAGDCISALAKFRARSNAFVVTNSVKIEGIADNSELPETFEVSKAFDVMQFINENLDEAQQVAVRKLSEVQR